MGILFWATTFDFLGKLLIVFMALLVHKRVRKEHRIDKRVLKQMRLEQSVGLMAIVFLIVGYILHINV